MAAQQTENEKTSRWSRLWRAMAVPVLSIILAMVIGGIILLFSGNREGETGASAVRHGPAQQGASLVRHLAGRPPPRRGLQPLRSCKGTMPQRRACKGHLYRSADVEGESLISSSLAAG